MLTVIGTYASDCVSVDVSAVYESIGCAITDAGIYIACSYPSRNWAAITEVQMDQQQRKEGMAAFRRKMLAAHERQIASGRLNAKELAYQRELVSTIKATQVRFGEVRS